MKRFLTGMEAIARSCAEEGVLLVSGHGARAIPALLDAARREGLRAERAPHQRIALELAVGASLAGARAVAAVEDLAAAAETLHACAHAGAGGLVVLALDDPGAALCGIASDSRAFARALEVPWLEPSDAGECKEYVAAALALSERWDVPVVMRLTAQGALGGRPVPVGPTAPGRAAGLRRSSARQAVSDRGEAARGHLQETLAEVAALGAESALDRVEIRSRELGVVTSGAPYHHVREALPEASVLKLGLAFPVPSALVRDFARRVDSLVVVEELEPILETEIRALGVGCRGKDLLPRTGELDPDLLARALAGAGAPVRKEAAPPRPAEACAGCPQRGLLHALKRLHVNVTADPGCASAAAPLGAMEGTGAGGSSLAIARGAAAVLGERIHGRIVAVTTADDLLRSGALALAPGPEGGVAVVAVEASVASSDHAPSDLRALAAALGVARVREVEALDVAATEAALREELGRAEPSVVIARGRCPMAIPPPHRPSRIRPESCNRCGACLRLGCPAISDRLDAMVIDPSSCAGCGLCARVCRAGAIERAAPAGASGVHP